MAPKDVEQGIEAMEQQLNGAATFISLTVLFVMLKLFTHRDKDHNWINLTIVAALVIFIVLCVFAIGMHNLKDSKSEQTNHSFSRRKSIHDLLSNRQ